MPPTGCTWRSPRRRWPSTRSGRAGRHALAAHGLSISVDDFGIGYTGLSQLRTLAVARSRSTALFVAGLADTQDRAIVGSVIDLAHGLGCTVTAEGVETQAVADWLADSGCDHAQGSCGCARPRGPRSPVPGASSRAPCPYRST